MAMQTVRETKATLTAEAGRVLVWHNDKEARFLSLAVPGDRAKLTPAQARELGLWLVEASERVTAPETGAFRTATTARPRTAHTSPSRW
ncbi:hypothetical protein QWJ26_07075 [Streptomyces sp. CSDS2]|uniref:hypothetical protein n=1 Tax=Streptomyces sp. CSDS2 TaxID=3055051 RepID=UPI0025B1DC9F|nr:hypothetical protein [Streptomyces sp. CSDS2]MDN3259579.1 hypothetical protein [Streptomyces sp. CSDS2]